MILYHVLPMCTSVYTLWRFRFIGTNSRANNKLVDQEMTWIMNKSNSIDMEMVDLSMSYLLYLSTRSLLILFNIVSLAWHNGNILSLVRPFTLAQHSNLTSRLYL